MPVRDPDLRYDCGTIAELARLCARQIKESGERFDGIVGIANGGVIPTLLFSKESGLPILDMMRLRRYDDDDKTSPLLTPEVLLPPTRARVLEKDIVLVDEVLDEGYSFVYGKQLLEATGARVVRGAVLDFKLGPRAEGHFVSLDFRRFFVGRVHEGRPWIEYTPWGAPGATRNGALRQFVEEEYLEQDAVDRVLRMLVDSREPAAA